jgi:hypothetical protein
MSRAERDKGARAERELTFPPPLALVITVFRQSRDPL